MRLGLKRKNPARKGQKAVPPAPPAPRPVPPPAVVTPLKSFDDLTHRQQQFVLHYVILKNATAAARKAGFSKKTAMAQGSRLFRNVAIRAEIDRRLTKTVAKLDITAEKVLREIGRVAFQDMANYLDEHGLPRDEFSGLGPDETAAIKSITVEEFMDGRSDKRKVRRLKFALGDKAKCLEILAKHFGLIDKEKEHDLRDGVTVLGLLLREIDAESRGRRVIEHDPAR